MGGSHTATLLVEVDSPIHRLAPTGKLLAHLGFVLVVVSTPAALFWAFAGYAILLAAVRSIARIPVGVVARRLVIEAPFVAFAVLLPFVASGERVTVLGLSLSAAGLLAGWNVLVKATLGVIASILLAATTETREILDALIRLRIPGQIVEIASFMVRYLSVVIAELGRMRIAQQSRGFDARHLGHAAIIARGAGTLFVRTYERGERVHLAMVSRGGGPATPVALHTGARYTAGYAAALLPMAALGVLVVGLAVTRAPA